MTSSLVDSNVLIDVLRPRADRWSEWARRWIAEARLAGSLVINPIVVAEVAFQFTDRSWFEAMFESPLWTKEALPFDACHPAATAHRQYRRRGGQRDRMLPDFLIGAHALIRGHRLLTRDARRYRSYFPDVSIIAPDTHP